MGGFEAWQNSIISKGQRQTLGRYLRALLYLFNAHTILLAGLGCLAVYACDRWRLQWNMDFTLVATGTTFPLVFTIQQAFTRREKALSLIANLKASAVGLYFMHRDWAQDENFPNSLGSDHTTAALQCKLLIMELLRDVRAYLVANSPFESYAEQRLAAKRHECANLFMADMSLSGASQLSFAVALERSERQDPAATALRRCYRSFSRLSVLNERLGFRAGYTKGGEGGMSRTNQYLRYMISNLEELRFIREYRTPIMMRAAHGVLLHLFAIMLAPYFVHFCDSWTALGYRRDSCPAGYSSSIVYCLIIMLLFNTQQDLENPFDMCGMDDVFFDLGHEMDDVMQPIGSMAATPSGCSSPRHGASALRTEDFICSSGPGSPGPRCHADLSWQHMGPWSQVQKGPAVLDASQVSRRGSMLGTVAEEESSSGGESAAEKGEEGACEAPEPLLVQASQPTAAAAAARASSPPNGSKEGGPLTKSLLSQQLRQEPRPPTSLQQGKQPAQQEQPCSAAPASGDAGSCRQPSEVSASSSRGPSPSNRPANPLQGAVPTAGSDPEPLESNSSCESGPDQQLIRAGTYRSDDHW